MASDVSLIFNLLAKDKATGTIGKVEKGLGKMGVAVAGMAVAAGVGLAKVGGDFHEAFSTIRIGTGATGDQLAGLEDSFKNVAATVPNAIGDTATVLADFNTLTGATGTDLEDLTRTFLNLEKITGESIGPETITRVFGDWGVATKDQASTMDELFRVSQTTGIGVSDLATKVVQFGAPLRNMGFSLEEATALFGKWQKEGVNTETVMSGLRTASGKWAREGKDLPTTLEATIKAIQGAGSEAKAQEIALENFGARAGPDMAAAVLEGKFSIDELMATLSGNDDTINGLATETETWQDKLAKLKNEGLVAIEPIASTVFDLLGQGVPILKSVGLWMQNNAGTVKALAIGLGALGASILLVNAGLKIYHGIQLVIRAATATWTAVQWLLNVALSANPIGLVIIAVAALIAIIVLIATKTDWFQKLWKVVWKGIKAAAAFVWNWIKGTLWPGIKRVLNSIVAAAKGVWKGVQLYFGFWRGLLNKVIGWVVSAKNRAVNALGRIVSFVRNIPSRIRGAFSRLVGIITGPFRNAFQGIRNAWNSTIGGRGFSTPSWIPGIGGKEFRIPFLAQGGIVTGPTLAMLGEAGRPEAVIPLPRGGGSPVAVGGGRSIGPDDLRMPSGSGLDRMFIVWLKGVLRKNNLRLVSA